MDAATRLLPLPNADHVIVEPDVVAEAFGWVLVAIGPWLSDAQWARKAPVKLVGGER